ncbi:glycosyltransferase [Aurantiacibacter luteus]|uniref:glycosyltransferase n=1 Tax=Aurantiacibacter luteus TaxID=1581420 RepID=UPI0009E1E7EF|nr:glycosyltransferase [Aurantiacibacter luteus]
MTSLHVVTDLARPANGVGVAVDELRNSLIEAGSPAIILTTGIGNGEGTYYFPVDFHKVPLLRKLKYSRALLSELTRQIADVQQMGRHVVLHAHGLWQLPSAQGSMLARALNVPVILSPHGMLSPAARSYSALRKKILWNSFQRRAIEAASCYHATSRLEHDEIRSLGFRGPVAIIPLGVDLKPFGTVSDDAAKTNTVLHLGRVHPKKGTDLLIEAWGKVESDFPDWKLRIVGPSEVGFVDTLKQRVKTLNLRQVEFSPGEFGAQKIETLKRSSIFVLPTRSDNFGIAVAEALACGTPVICSKNAPWSGLISNQCGWYIDLGVEPLAKALREAMELNSRKREAMGANGREWISKEFSTEKAANSFVALYNWVAGKAERPSFIEI